MKTKPKPRARKMWANYYPTGIVCHSLRRKARINAPANCLSAAVPVAVIPLDDVEALISKATDAFLLKHCGPISCILEDRMRSALIAIGVLPRQRKGGAK